MTDYHLQAEAGGFTVVAHPVGVVVEGDPDHPDGRSVVSKPASGGESESHVDRDGNVSFSLVGPLDVGRPNEWHVMKVLVQALANDGSECFPSGDASDDRGEDGAVLVDGARLYVQVVSVPADDRVWRNLARTTTSSKRLEYADVVQMVRDAIERKQHHARADTILCLDAAHIGAAVGPRLVEGYIAAHGDPVSEGGWHSVWLVGPTIGSTRRLGF